MYSESINNAISNISSTMKCCDIHKIAQKCLDVSEYRTIDQFSGDDYSILRQIEAISFCPLNDKLDLPPKMFAAQQNQVEYRLRLQKMEAMHAASHTEEA